MQVTCSLQCISNSPVNVIKCTGGCIRLWFFTTRKGTPSSLRNDHYSVMEAIHQWGWGHAIVSAISGTRVCARLCVYRKLSRVYPEIFLHYCITKDWVLWCSNIEKHQSVLNVTYKQTSTHWATVLTDRKLQNEHTFINITWPMHNTYTVIVAHMGWESRALGCQLT